MNIKLVVGVISLFIFLFVIDLIRREKLTFKYALFWLMASVAAVFAAFYEKALFGLAKWLGFELPSNFIFFLIGALFVVASLVLTVYICQQNTRSEKMAQKIGILEMEVEKLKNNGKDKDRL